MMIEDFEEDDDDMALTHTVLQQPTQLHVFSPPDESPRDRSGYHNKDDVVPLEPFGATYR